MPFEDGKHYVVLEGNRGLTELRALENPDLLVDSLSSGLLTQIRRLSKGLRWLTGQVVNLPFSVNTNLSAKYLAKLETRKDRGPALEVRAGSFLLEARDHGESDPAGSHCRGAHAGPMRLVLQGPVKNQERVPQLEFNSYHQPTISPASAP